jgi:hypothetical protein
VVGKQAAPPLRRASAKGGIHDFPILDIAFAFHRRRGRPIGAAHGRYRKNRAPAREFTRLALAIWNSDLPARR